MLTLSPHGTKNTWHQLEMKNRTLNRAQKGFTLVELMVTIVIVVVLAGLAFSLAKNGLKRANSTKDLATMKQIYQTIPLYAGDNGGFLPGPIYTGVKAVYRPRARGRLANYIAPYLGYDNPAEDEYLPAMGYTWQKTEHSRNTNCAFIRKDVLVRGSEDEFIRPFGHLPSGGDPMKMSAVFSKIDLARTWFISDLDQLHPDVGNPSWKSDIPAEMSHGTFRIAIYYDGHAGKLNVDNEPR